jgi:ABC-2 type transport system ATP-binding protein
MSAAGGPAIVVEDLTKAYGDVTANDSLSFEVRRGEIFGYLGPNGAGKSTTIRTLMGFQSPTDGTASILGYDVQDRRERRAAMADVGYLPGSPRFDEDVTGERYLDYLARLKGDSRRAELLELFDPPLSRKIREYSTGNRQMLGIVQAFMHDPELVLMDEPTSGLDPLKQERFHSFLRDEREAGKTMFLSSHVLSEVRRVCDRVGIIRDGRLVTVEAVDALLRRGGKRVTVHTTEPVTESALTVDGVVDLTLLDSGARFVFTGDYGELLAALSELSLVDVEIEEPPLEDVFMHYYGPEAGEAATDATDEAGTRRGRDRDDGRTARDERREGAASRGSEGDGAGRTASGRGGSREGEGDDGDGDGDGDGAGEGGRE